MNSFSGGLSGRVSSEVSSELVVCMGECTQIFLDSCWEAKGLLLLCFIK